MLGVSKVLVSIVLVHGGFVDGSGWQGVYDALIKDGYRVIVVQNPTTSLQDDVAVTRRTIDAIEGPVVLVGHSYGGVVVTKPLHAHVSASGRCHPRCVAATASALNRSP